MNNTDDNNEDTTKDDFEIEEMQTKETSFSLDQIARQCSPLQYVRELTKNAIEAIPKEEEGEIFWTYDKDELDESGIHKLTCIDSGLGMDGEEERLYMNNMYSSIKEQTAEGNFGIGAKVAALSRSPKGLLYKSYKDGKGYLAELCQHPISGKYGLRQQLELDGSLTPYMQIPFDSMPEELRGNNATSGTMVPDTGFSSFHWPVISRILSPTTLSSAVILARRASVWSSTILDFLERISLRAVHSESTCSTLSQSAGN